MIKDVVIMLCAIAMVVIVTILAFCCVMILDSCTISFSNTDTHGTATIDENQAARGELTVPVTI